MKIPLFDKSKRLSVTTPALCGGIDGSQEPWLLADDTLSDCRDVWWKDGALCTRPGFWTSEAWKGSETTGAQVRYYTDREGWILGVSVLGGAMTVTARDPIGGSQAQLLRLTLPVGSTYACVAAGGSVGDYTLLMYVSNGTIWALHPSRWLATEVTDRIHVPVITLDGHPCQGLILNDSEGVPYQERNRLTERVRCCFTPDGVGTYYYLPYRHITGEFCVVYSGMAGSVWTYTVKEDEIISDTQEGRYLVLDRSQGMFYFIKKDENVVMPYVGFKNTIVAECSVPFEEPLVYDMQFGTWYGGDKSTTGGQRLFLSGHNRALNRVVWSVAENPFYFPENATTTVGVSGEAVTAFGKQDGNLVLFKEREIYTAEYIRGGTDVDDTAESVFPVYTLNSEIGCDLPSTVGLVDNRLIWACRDGSVYRLTRLNALGSRNVEKIGEKVKRWLKPHITHQNVSAQVCDGVYYLLCGKEMFVLTDSEKTCWYRFAWPDNGFVPSGVYRSKNALRIAARAETDTDATQWFSLDGEADIFPQEDYTTRPINGMICTKAFDFGQPSVYKQVVRAAVQSTRAITPSYLTECGEYTDGIHCPDAGGLVRCTPHVSRCRRMALRLSGEKLSVGGLTVEMRAERGSRW